ncbi:MAG: hypothetical protein OET90_08690, partial [Desulfuromonadales bacterium]|nr:hypothetical protein [Desulfuromonadales bacterium]
GIDKLFPDEVSRGLAEHLLECENADGELPENLFAATFSDRQQSLLSELLLLEDDGWADNAEQIFEDCRRATEHAQLRQRLKALVSLEQQAQQQNDEALLVQCLRERTEINQKLKKKP